MSVYQSECDAVGHVTDLSETLIDLLFLFDNPKYFDRYQMTPRL